MTSHSLPGFLGKSKMTERKRPLERRGERRETPFLLHDCNNGGKKKRYTHVGWRWSRRRDLVPFLSFSSVSLFFNLKVELSSPAAALADGFCRRTKMANNNRNYAEFGPWVNLSFYWSKASSCIKRLCGLAELRRRCTASRRVGVVPLCLTPEAKMFHRRHHAVSLLDPPQSASRTWKHRRPSSDGLEKRCLTPSLCITSVYFGFHSVCFSVCLKLTLVNTLHCQRQNTMEKRVSLV